MSTVYSEAVRAIAARLTYHAKLGGILEGWKVVLIARAETEPVADLPSVRLQGLAVEEEGQTPRAANSAKVTVALEIAVKRSEGVAALADGVALVMDAIETSTDDDADAQIEQTTMNAMTNKAEGSGATGTAFFTHVAVTVGTKPFMRGNRRGA